MLIRADSPRALMLHMLWPALAALAFVFTGCQGPSTDSPEEAAAARAAMLPGKVGPSGEVVMVVSQVR